MHCCFDHPISSPAAKSLIWFILHFWCYGINDCVCVSTSNNLWMIIVILISMAPAAFILPSLPSFNNDEEKCTFWKLSFTYFEVSKWHLSFLRKLNLIIVFAVWSNSIRFLFWVSIWENKTQFELPPACRKKIDKKGCQWK